jgi:DNA-binding transcriptional regulator YiaG
VQQRVGLIAVVLDVGTRDDQRRADAAVGDPCLVERERGGSRVCPAGAVVDDRALLAPVLGAQVERLFQPLLVADVLGADSQSVNAWERNCRQPVLRRLPAIAAFLGYNLENVSDDASLGLRIASRRRRLGLSQKRLAELLGIDEATVRKWERGRIFLRVDERVRRILQRWVNSGG